MMPETSQASQSSEAGSWLDRVLGAAAAVLLFGMMSLTTADIVSRYLLNWPLRGALEITELMLLTLVFAGLPLASRAGEHVTLDFIDLLFGPQGQEIVRRAVDLVCGVIILALAWRVWVKADKIAAYGDTTDVLRLPIAPFVYFMTVMVALTGVIHLVKVIFPGPRRGQQIDPEKVSTT